MQCDAENAERWVQPTACFTSHQAFNSVAKGLKKEDPSTAHGCILSNKKQLLTLNNQIGKKDTADLQTISLCHIKDIYV